jgi:carboxymethylenebutenolidase
MYPGLVFLEPHVTVGIICPVAGEPLGILRETWLFKIRARSLASKGSGRALGDEQVVAMLENGYLRQAAGGASVIVLHESYGLLSPSSNVPEFCDRLAAAGYTAFAPDLYGGASATTEDDALKLMETLRDDDLMGMIQAAVWELRGQGQSHIALLGFCMGGGLSFRAALTLDGLAGTVMFYATPRGQLECLSVPVLGHFALADRFVSVDAVRAAEAGLRSAGKAVIFHYYEAEHSFMNEKLPAFSHAAAELAWQRTLRFLDRMSQ